MTDHVEREFNYLIGRAEREMEETRTQKEREKFVKLIDQLKEGLLKHLTDPKRK